jgi:hypothetical protein
MRTNKNTGFNVHPADETLTPWARSDLRRGVDSNNPPYQSSFSEQNRTAFILEQKSSDSQHYV